MCSPYIAKNVSEANMVDDTGTVKGEEEEQVWKSKVIFDVKSVMDEVMTVWQIAHAYEDLARMALEGQRMDMYAAFKMAQSSMVQNFYILLMSKQSEIIQKRIEMKHEEEKTGDEGQYAHTIQKWENMEKGALAENASDEPKSAETHAPACNCWNCYEARRKASESAGAVPSTETLLVENVN